MKDSIKELEPKFYKIISYDKITGVLKDFSYDFSTIKVINFDFNTEKTIKLVDIKIIIDENRYDTYYEVIEKGKIIYKSDSNMPK